MMKIKDVEKLDEIVQESFRLLEKVLKESQACGYEDDYREAFICRHARSIYALGQDVMFLIESGRLDSCQLIVRVMLESLFKLMASVNQPEAAIQILISEVEADTERMIIFDPIACAPGIKCGGEFTAKLRSEHNITSRKKWTVYECADAACLIDRYRGDYFVFSGRVHASSGGIMLQENKIGAGHSLQTLLFILILASGGFAQVVQTETPQLHVDGAARLIKNLAELMDSGIFSELDGDLEEIELP